MVCSKVVEYKIDTWSLGTKSGDSRMICTICLDCLKRHQITKVGHRWQARAEIVGNDSEVPRVSINCFRECTAVKAASKLTQKNLILMQETSNQPEGIMPQLPTERIFNAMNTTCKIRTVITTGDQCGQFEDHMVGGFI